MVSPSVYSEPVCCRLLDPEGGRFFISSPTGSTQVKPTQHYLPNTNNILVTEVSTSMGDSFNITDFCRVSNNMAASIDLRCCFESWDLRRYTH